MTELQLTNKLNEKYNMNLVLATDRFSSYDASSEDYIVEYKSRRKYYATKQIEALKLFKNFQAAQLAGKEFLYIVEDSKGVYVFNISTKIDVITNQKIQAVRCPKNTDFGNRSKIIKYTYNLPENLSKIADI